MDRKAAFYLGKRYDLEKHALDDSELTMYDARDLTTHAVCIGMTGSGKTGLGILTLEEATLDGIPSIIIDPKGDMTNLLLAFPDLAPADFEPWVNADDARRKGMTAAEYAESVATMWRHGLAEWGQDGERVRRFKESAEFTVFTPGSDAGVPVSILQTLRAPGLSWDTDEEIIREMISGTVSGLLGLVGIDADPVRSREHILLAHILEHAWRRNQDLDIGKIITAIQKPPMERLGVLDLDVFYPENERFKLALALNAVIASPSFENWLEGAPLDLDDILYTDSGKPRASIFYIAHLSEAERMFFVTMLLQSILSWTRRQSGTTSLRCLVYFDEVFGYFPPYPANPPSKTPMLSLLKTARAFGVGMMLTTQNPVDLDYKGLTNAGTWFIGKLQTDRDKARVLEGLESVVSEAGTLLDRSYLDRLISSLGSRVFLLHNVHEDAPQLFQTRWALSYLRGPLTRDQVRDLDQHAWTANSLAKSPASASAPVGHRAEPVPAAAAAAPQAQLASAESAPLPEGYTPVQPPVSARVAQFYLPVRIAEQQAAQSVRQLAGPRAELAAGRIVYDPYMLDVATVLYRDGSREELANEMLAYLVPASAKLVYVNWDDSLVPDFDVHLLSGEPIGDVLYGLIPDEWDDSPPYTQKRNELVTHIQRNRTVMAWENAELRLDSAAGETEKDFAARCEQAAEEECDAELDKVRTRLDRQITTLSERLRREEQELEEDRIEFQGRKQEEIISAGESILGALLGRKRSSALSQASRRRRMTKKARADITESERAIERLQKQVDDLVANRDAELERIREKWADAAASVREAPVHATKADIQIDAHGLCWAPRWLFQWTDSRGALRQETAEAFPIEAAGA